MSDYSIKVVNGKVIGDSTFYILANDMLDKEIKRLCDFTDTLDKDPKLKKERIAEYKCAKYRFASVCSIYINILHNNRCRKMFNIEYSNYIQGYFDDLLKAHTDYYALYKSAPANEKPDFSLYYSSIIFTEKEISDLKEKVSRASDWEKVELEERIGGLEFAKQCLDDAFKRRKEVIL